MAANATAPGEMHLTPIVRKVVCETLVDDLDAIWAIAWSDREIPIVLLRELVDESMSLATMLLDDA